MPGPNYLWHIDGNHKMIKYGLVVHGGIDGFSRLVTYLKCSNNNRADTVLDAFDEATRMYGVPFRVRSDKGGENVDVWNYMERVRGHGRSSFIILVAVCIILVLRDYGGMCTHRLHLLLWLFLVNLNVTMYWIPLMILICYACTTCMFPGLMEHLKHLPMLGTITHFPLNVITLLYNCTPCILLEIPCLRIP